MKATTRFPKVTGSDKRTAATLLGRTFGSGTTAPTLLGGAAGSATTGQLFVLERLHGPFCHVFAFALALAFGQLAIGWYRGRGLSSNQKTTVSSCEPAARYNTTRPQDWQSNWKRGGASATQGPQDHYVKHVSVQVAAKDLRRLLLQHFSRTFPQLKTWRCIAQTHSSKPPRPPHLSTHRKWRQALWPAPC